MEVNKTLCRDCGFEHRWHSYKWADTRAKKKHNQTHSTMCPKCGSENVQNVEDDETMGPARAMVDVLFGPRIAEATKGVKVVAHTARGHVFDDPAKPSRRVARQRLREQQEQEGSGAEMDGREPDGMDARRKADERVWARDEPSSGRKEKRMKVYVSGTSKRADLANEVMQRLQDLGFEITFDWTIDIPNEGDMDAEEMARRAEKAIDAVKAADAVVLLVTKEMRGVGSMIEIGAALGNRQKVLVAELEDGFNHFFSFHPNVWRAHSVTGVVQQLQAIQGA